MKEFDEKLSDGNKEAISAALATLKEAHAAKDLAKIDTAMEGLNNAWAAASQEIYDQGEAAGAQGQPGAEQQEAAGGDSAEDVEFEEVKDK